MSQRPPVIGTRNRLLFLSASLAVAAAAAAYLVANWTDRSDSLAAPAKSEPLETPLDQEVLARSGVAEICKRGGRIVADLTRPDKPIVEVHAPGTPLRDAELTHLKDWSFRTLERELRASLLYRRFTRFYEDAIPDFTSFSRAFALFGKDLTAQVHARVVLLAEEQGVAPEKLAGSDPQVAERMRAVFDAGADQVVLNLVTADPKTPYLEELRILAPVEGASK